MRTSPWGPAVRAPFRISSSGSAAAVRVAGGTVGAARWIWSVIVVLAEYGGCPPRRAGRVTDAWVLPPESVRTGVRRPRRYFFGSRARAGRAGAGRAVVM
ncbi:hypothetical protein ACIBO9_00080 [Streptomyces prunicolor]|uniref:hypothetical protein n=1 Tax=Streptomyces prunicolor TaxID=67348 RepID=UPI0037D2680C